MTMQDRVYAAAIFIIMGICCIGAYVAVSGFMNQNPDGFKIGLNLATTTPTAGVTVEIPTETAAPPTNTSLPATKTPIGFQPTAIPAATRGPTLDFIPTIATLEASPTPEASATPQPSGCGAEFCPRLGPPDGRAPSGNPCPPNYLWGFVLDRNGQGIPGIKVTFRDANGNAGESDTKAPPDPPGRFDFPVGGGTWTVQVAGRKDASRSGPIQMAAGQTWTGSGNCPTRVDFVQQ